MRNWPHIRSPKNPQRMGGKHGFIVLSLIIPGKLCKSFVLSNIVLLEISDINQRLVGYRNFSLENVQQCKTVFLQLPYALTLYDFLVLYKSKCPSVRLKYAAGNVVFSAFI